MKFFIILAFSAVADVAFSSPTPALDKRETICGQWDTIATGNYTVYENLWGKSPTTSGSQCTTITSESDGTLAWFTSWSWYRGHSAVKSYANVVMQQSTGIQLEKISSIPSTWSWGYTGKHIVADVSFDMFISSSAKGSTAIEIMVWLAAYGGAAPLSSKGSPIATLSIADMSWILYEGLNGNTTVFSFVATSTQSNWSCDMNYFFSYLISNRLLSEQYYLTSIGAGTEAFTGADAVFETSAYKIEINHS